MNYSHGKIWPKIKEELYKKYNMIASEDDILTIIHTMEENA